MIDETRETVERLTAPIDHDALRAQREETGSTPLYPPKIPKYRFAWKMLVQSGRVSAAHQNLSVKPSHGFQRSGCCGEPLYVAGEGLTHWYACSSCGEPQ